MSRIEKLKVLLARVEQRRAEPRLVAVSSAGGQVSANTNVEPTRTREPQLELAKPLPPVAQPPSSIPPPSAAASISTSSLPPVARTQAPSSTVPPVAPGEAQPTGPQRIAPQPVVPFDSAVRTTSAARIQAPKTFGELLEQSLALRPKSG